MELTMAMELSLTIAYRGSAAVIAELERLARIHNDNADYTTNPRAKVAAIGAAMDCETAIAAIRDDSLICLATGPIVQINTALARLAR